MNASIDNLACPYALKRYICSCKRLYRYLFIQVEESPGNIEHPAS